MPKGRSANPRAEHDGAWFAHIGLCQSQPESTTGSALKQVQSVGEAQYIAQRLPPGYRAREQKAVNNNFPFSSHDNRHCLQNVGEYFDFVSTLERGCAVETSSEASNHIDFSEDKHYNNKN
uniref:Testis expressed 36 n=1 Tax=Dromaius novaehollandiae TaxID=8790 RepID=A0A8C4J7L8_DRONO